MDLKFKEYYQDNHRSQSGIQYPRPLTGAGIGGYLGYAFGGLPGAAAGAAMGYGIGKLAGPRATSHDNPRNWIYYRKEDGTVDRDMPPEVDLTPEEAEEANADSSSPYYYKPLPNGKYRGILKRGSRRSYQRQQPKQKSNEPQWLDYGRPNVRNFWASPRQDTPQSLVHTI